MNIELIPLELIDETTILRRSAHDNVEELAKNISQNGLLQPITVKKLTNGRYRIILGTRRFRAFQLLNKTSIPAILSSVEDETEIYLQQLAENMEREDFSPIEQAKLFHKLMSDENFRMSELYLSQKIGKTQNYIKKKIELLKFSKDVQDIIHGGKEILPNKLNEEQVLSLKNVNFMYKDKLAIKVASEQVPVVDIKKAVRVFSSTEIGDDSKIDLLSIPFHNIIETWSLVEQNEHNKQKYVEKPKLVDSSFSPLLNEAENIQPIALSEIECLLKGVITNIPSHRPIPVDTVYTYESIPVERRREFLRLIDGLVDNLQAHLIEWRKIQDIVKSPMRLINPSNKK